jgi:hypothetical protein
METTCGCSDDIERRSPAQARPSGLAPEGDMLCEPTALLFLTGRTPGNIFRPRATTTDPSTQRAMRHFSSHVWIWRSKLYRKGQRPTVHCSRLTEAQRALDSVADRQREQSCVPGFHECRTCNHETLLAARCDPPPDPVFEELGISSTDVIAVRGIGDSRPPNGA